MGALQKVAGLLGDAVMLLLLVWLFPVAIIVVGAPVALLVRLFIEIAKRVRRCRREIPTADFRDARSRPLPRRRDDTTIVTT